MKKFLTILLALVLALSVFALIACNDTETPEEKPEGAIRLRSEAVLNLQVGDVYKLVFDAKYGDKNAKNDVNFASSNDSVVTVDAFGNITAVGAGEETVTISLKQDESVTATVTCKVIKTFFMTKATHSAGNVDPTTADSKGWVRIMPGEQTQLLVSECAENWYFKTKLEHTGDTGADSSGRWGIGSFLVDDTHAIGNTMAWFGFQSTDHANKRYTPYVGGWRVQSGGNDPEIPFADPMTNAGTAVFEMIRYGTELYCTVTVGEQVAKYVYSTPSLAGKATYPGVYSQRQELFVSEFEATSNLQQVIAKLSAFQVAEAVEIEGLSSDLLSGDTYTLHAKVLPATTFDKDVTFSLKQAVEGVSITAQGVLTIGASVTGEITVVAKANSSNAQTEKTFTVNAKQTNDSELFDINNVVGVLGQNFTLADNSVTFTGGTNFVALNAKSAKWAVTFKTTSYKVGVFSADAGFCSYAGAYLDNGQIRFVTINGITNTFFKTAAEYEVTVIRDGNYMLVVVNGLLVDRFNANIAGDTMPVIAAEGVATTVAEIALVKEASEVDALIAAYPFTVGSDVTVNGNGSYTLIAKDYGNSKADINWPPVNNYQNGLKFANTVTGNYTIEFTMSNVKPYGSNADGKVLIYLRSETATSSLQFTFKGQTGAVETKFCPNLNDATWDEYAMPEGFNLMGADPVKVKVVKTATKVELYLNDTLVFENHSGLNNNGYWNANTLCTPGIGTFKCGVTISNVSLTINND